MHDNAEISVEVGASTPRGARPSHLRPVSAMSGGHLRVEALSAFYGAHRAVSAVSMEFAPRRVTAIIGPSGCGKSTLLRCLNRMHELTRNAHAEGRIELDGQDVMARDVDPVVLRRHVGMVFQRPNPFPNRSVAENVLAGLTLTGRNPGREGPALVESALRSVGLWDEVKDRLGKPGGSLSGGQQQRLCIARAIAVSPRVLLMDEPCSALDPIATGRIEELIRELAARYTIAIVTHNMQQAARASDQTAFMLMGELVEFGATSQVFTTPQDPRTEAYVRGKFG
jgi:phosphate transport system ATP-binding protein